MKIQLGAHCYLFTDHWSDASLPVLERLRGLGGEVLEILIQEKWKVVRDKLQALYESPESLQLLQLVQQEEADPMTPNQLQVRLGISKKQIEEWVSSEEKLFWLIHNKSKCIVT